MSGNRKSGSRRKPPDMAGSSEVDVHTAAREGNMIALEDICNANPLAVNSRDKHSRTPGRSPKRKGPLSHAGLRFREFEWRVSTFNYAENHVNLNVYGRAAKVFFQCMKGFSIELWTTLELRLHLAAWSGKNDAVAFLCKRKADVKACAIDDMGAIHFASQKGHLEVVRCLLSSGASVNSCTRKGLTPLHSAVQGSHLELIKYLLKKGANMTVKTKAGKLPVDLAQNDETKLFLQNLGDSGNEGKHEEEGSSKDEKPEVAIDNERDASVEGPGANEEKRKHEEDENGESTREVKRSKIALGHLLATDDIQEDVEETNELKVEDT